MGLRVTRIAKWSVIALVGVAPASVFAGLRGTGIVGFAPADALAVPALSGPMLAALGLLMAVFAIRIFRSSSSNLGKMSSLGLVSGGVLLMAVNGVESLRAIPSEPITLAPKSDQCGTGAEIRYSFHPYGHEFLNSCPNRLEIVRLECDFELRSLEQRNDVLESCTLGLVLDPDQRCSLPECEL